MKFSGITIISDMDGTLLTEDKSISSENLKAIDYFRKNGGSFTIASGRIYKKILIYSNILDFSLPVISHNGTVIYDYKQDKILYKAFLEGNYKDVAEEIFNDYPFTGMEVYTEHDVKFLKNNEYIHKHILDEGFSEGGEGVKWYNFHELPESWCKILMANSRENNDFLEKILPEKYPQYQFVRSEAHYYEILPHNISKGSAAEKLMEIIDKPQDKLYTIGDNMNDAEMLKYAKTGIALKNASEGLKAVSDIVFPQTNEENAVAKIIEMIDKGEM